MLSFEQKMMIIFMRKASATQPLPWIWELTPQRPVQVVQLQGVVRKHTSGWKWCWAFLLKLGHVTEYFQSSNLKLFNFCQK